MNRHDYFKPECKKMNLEHLGTHSNGTKFYYCKNCRYAGKESSFTKEFHISELLEQIRQESW